MKGLVVSQLRLVRTSVLVFTALGLIAEPLLAGCGFDVGSVTPGASLWVSFLAASLGARLFAHDPYIVECTHWRSLPLTRARWFWIKVGVGLALLMVSFAIQWLGTSSGFHAGLEEWARGDRVARTPFEGARPFLPLETLSQALLTFAATIYFANSFERPSAARQAGLPAFFSAFMLTQLGEGQRGLMRPLGSWWPDAIFIVIGIVCAQRLHARRGLDAATSHERLLGPGRGRDTAAHVLGQVVFVVAPLVMSAGTPAVFLAPYLDIPIYGAEVLLVLLVGLIALPSSWREKSVHRLKRAPAAALLLLRTSGIGIPIWKALRRSRSIAKCAGCQTLRDARLSVCPRCGARRTCTIPRPRGVRAQFSGTPWSVAVLIVVFYASASMAWGWIRPVYLQEWSMISDLPGVQLSSLRQPAGSAGLNGSQLIERSVAPISSDFAWLNPTIVPSESAPPLSTEALRRAFAASHRGPKDEQAERLLPIGGHETFEIRAPGGDVRISSFSVDYRFNGTSMTTRTTLSLRVPALEDRADALLHAAVTGEPSHEDIAAAARLEDPFLTILVRHAKPVIDPSSAPSNASNGQWMEHRRDRAERCHRLLDSILEERYGKRTMSHESVARTQLKLLAERERFAPEVDDPQAPPIDLSYFYAPVRVLAWTAPPDLLEDEMRSGNAFAAIAAGIARDARSYEACRDLYRACFNRILAMGFPARHSREEKCLVAAACAMLCIDRERAGADIIEQLRGAHRPWPRGLQAVLLYSGSAPVRQYLQGDGSSSGSGVVVAEAHMQDEWAQVVHGIDVGWQPQEYWLGW